jgi:heterodisulfide reductase subunit A-like polyferredoxin
MVTAIEDARAAGERGPGPTGSVMVLGAGIGGMQAALDLTEAGFLVHLVTRDSSIGGKMTQLDKTFPTNECAMCLLGPKMSDCRGHPNIEIHTLTSLLNLDGEAGHFTARVRRLPRYVDADECTGCADCEAVCPVSVEDRFNLGLSERKAIHRLFPQAVPSSYLIEKRGTPPCREACPAGTNAQGYIALISQGKFSEALEVIRRRMPFPGVCGRICHRPCEDQCNRSEYDDPVAIASLKRAAWDYGWPGADSVPQSAPPPAADRQGTVAIIGGGPAGLSCAADLRALGWQVTVFEASDEPGGQMIASIPSYRLDQEVVRKDVRHLLETKVPGSGSIEVRTGVRVGKDVLFADLRRDYGAVLIAVGTQQARGLALPGADTPGVLLALDFLRDARAGRGPNLSGKRVLVIGGGAVAMDVACTALRLGASRAEAACLESRAEMPAHSWEIEDALNEGVIISPSWGPRAVLTGGGNVRGALLHRCAAVFDAAGRFAPTFVPDSDKEFPCDVLILAIGQGTDLSLLSPDPDRSGVKIQRNGAIEVDALTLATSAPGVFACGDVVKGAGSVVEAVGAGHEAAVSIDRYLRGEDLAAGRGGPQPEKLGPPEGRKVIVRRRLPAPQAAPAERRRDWREVNLGFSAEEAISEARRCLNCGICSECLQCELACKKAALRHAEQASEEEIRVGAVIAAPGFDLFDASLEGQFGYGVYPNVVTSIEFERMLSATGPSMGVLERPSDKRHPRRIAFLQCVGSREAPKASTCGAPYCSAICCMYSVKEAVIAREHDRAIEPTIFLLDLRAFGKGFDRYAESAEKDYGVRFIRQMVSAVREDPVTGDLIIRYWHEATPDGPAGQVAEERFDLVVLAVGVQPPAGARELAEGLGIELRPDGFAKTALVSPNQSTRPGVLVAGGFQGPRDIPETVMNGSAAAAAAAELLGAARGSLVRLKEYPPERGVTGEAPRVGVFVCRCGINIAGVVDVPAVVEYASGLPGVVHAQEFMFTCSQDSVAQIRQCIAEHNLNRVVVASCTIRTHQPLFREAMREAGLNQFLFEMANIRDQCSWVHRDYPLAALAKAKDLVHMAVAKVRRQVALHLQGVAVVQRAMVIGGGAAGMTAALSFADQGFPTYLVEREQELGGNMRHLHRGPSGEDLGAAMREMIARVEGHPLITLMRRSEVVEFGGHAGHFQTVVQGPGGARTQLEHGVIVVATGLKETESAGREYLYGEHPLVISTLGLDRMLRDNPSALKAVRRVVFIQCVGTRSDERPYCSRTCCTETAKCALEIKELSPGTELIVLNRDVRTYGFYEELYRKAREQGVLFVRYEPDRRPSVRAAENGGLEVSIFDPGTGAELTLDADLLVLAMGMEPRADAAGLATLFKVPRSVEGFYLENHIKLSPMDFPSPGLFLCGLCHSPKFVDESIYQARGAAARASTVLSKKELWVGGVVAVVDPDRCAACLTCVRSCPYSVPAINRDGVAEINAVQCHGCGTCAAECPGKAITLQHYGDDQLVAEVAALFVAAGGDAGGC